MDDISRLQIYTVQTSEGRWLAATAAAPYFCFESDSQEAVTDIAARALRFYTSVKDRLETEVQTSKGRSKAVPTFDPKNKISAKELVAA
jgi:hypothetical protein